MDLQLLENIHRSMGVQFDLDEGYKEVQQKFGEDSVEVINDFKDLLKRNMIKNVDAKNIDWWGKKSFEEFKSFVEEMKLKKSNTTLKKETLGTNHKGSLKVFENDNYIGYQIKNYDASVFMGRKFGGVSAKWCISTDEPRYWEKYTQREANTFIFFYSKKLTKEDEMYKVAIGFDTDKINEAFDIDDVELKGNALTLFLKDLGMTKPKFIKTFNEKCNLLNLEMTNALIDHVKTSDVKWIKENLKEVMESIESAFGYPMEVLKDPEHIFNTHDNCISIGYIEPERGVNGEWTKGDSRFDLLVLKDKLHFKMESQIVEFVDSSIWNILSKHLETIEFDKTSIVSGSKKPLKFMSDLIGAEQIGHMTDSPNGQWFFELAKVVIKTAGIQPIEYLQSDEKHSCDTIGTDVVMRLGHTYEKVNAKTNFKTARHYDWSYHDSLEVCYDDTTKLKVVEDYIKMLVNQKKFITLLVDNFKST